MQGSSHQGKGKKGKGKGGNNINEPPQMPKPPAPKIASVPTQP